MTLGDMVRSYYADFSVSVSGVSIDWYRWRINPAEIADYYSRSDDWGIEGLVVGGGGTCGVVA